VSGASQWISSEDSRKKVHRLRNQVDAVLVGSGTVIADDPQLTCRIAGGRNPWRVVLDRRLRIAPSAQLFRLRDPEKTLVVTSHRSPAARVRALEARGAKVLRLAERRNGKIPWRAMLKGLGRQGIQSVMIEGGAATAASALKDKAVDKVLFFYAPKIIGGDGRVMIDGLGIKLVKNSLTVKRLETNRAGDDIIVSGYL
jgi:diaminohydroxyphosphoribosylaminopyrimidine deaminase/5-amino-6-(5-phosphoribosylamino)uracil reductase